jgi:methyl-accepting chemotaxis protein
MLKSSSGEKVYNVSTPFYEGTKAIGTINIGVSLESMIKVIQNNFIQSLFISLIILLAAVLVGIVISNTISKPLSVIVEELDLFAQGDFTVNFKGKGIYEVKRLTDGLNSSINILKLTIRDIKNVVVQLNGISQNLLSFGEIASTSTKDVSESVGDVFKGTFQQNENISEIVKRLELFGDTLDNVNVKIENVAESSSKIKENADIGAEKLKVLVESIEDVRNSFKIANKDIEILNSDVSKIGDITNVINGVAEETNLLALNAAIEAARAGESGRGFAVVADEIRKI